MKKIHVLVGLAIGSMVLSACGTGGGSNTAASPSTAASTASVPSGGKLLIWADEKKAEAVKPVAEEFGKENGVTIEVQAVTKDLQSQFVTASQAGNAPDVLIGAHDWIGNLAQNGAIDPVQLSNTAAFDPSTIKAVTYNGQVYGVPYSRENLVLFRNTALAPNAPTSVEDMVSTGKSLKSSGKTSEIMAQQVGQNGDVYHMQPLLTAGGGGIFATDAQGQADPKQVIIDSPESIAAMTKIQKLGEKGDGALKRSIDDKNAISTFTSGKAAYLVSGPWAIADIKKANIKYDISAIPTFQGGKPAQPFIGVNAFYVASKGKNKVVANEFVNNYASTDVVQTAMYNGEPRPPAQTAVFDKVSATDPDMQKILDAGKDGVPMPSIPEMGKVFDPVGKAQANIVGGADVASTLKSAADAVRQAIG